MATGITVSNTSNLSTGQKIFLGSAKMAFEPEAPDPDLVDTIRIPQGHKQWDIQTYARLAQAQALTEGVDLAAPEQLANSTLTVTPAERGIISVLSKRLIFRQGDSDVISVAGKQLAGSLRRRLANDVIAIYDTFTKSVGGNTVALDITYFRGTVAYLLTDNNTSYGPAPMPLFGALHIEQISDIILDITDPGAVVSSRFGLSADMLQRWWKGSDRLYGVGIFHSGNITRDASSGSKGAIFAKEAIALVMAAEAEVTEQDDKSLRAIEYGLFQSFAAGLRADPHGVEVFSDTGATV